MDGLNALVLVLVLAGAAPALEWSGDLAAAQAAAGEGLVLVHVRAPARPLAAAMERDTWNDAAVAAAVAGLRPVRLDAEADAATCARLIGGRAGLGTVLVDGGGDVIAVLPGYAAPATLIAWLDTARAGHPALVAARQAARAGDAAAQLALGDRYHALSSPQRAAACWAAALAAAGPQPAGADRQVAATVHARLARSELAAGRNLAAREHLAACRRLDPDDGAALTGALAHSEALVLLIERDHRAAADLARRALAQGGDAADHCLHTLGLAEHGAGRDAAALTAFGDLLARFPASRWADSAREQIAHVKDPQADHGH